MALIGNNADTLLHGLSAFWHRFFRDIGDIQATYEGTEILFGQVYLNFLSDVLNTSAVEAPLFRKEFYKLITIREDQLVYHEKGTELDAPPGTQFYGNRGNNRYVYTSDTFFGAIPHLQDRIFAPATSFEEGVDYRVAGGELQLKVDPTNPVPPGYAQRRVVIAIGGKFTSSTTTNWLAAGVEKGDTLYYSESTDLGIGTPLIFNALLESRTATIIHVTDKYLTVSIDTPFPTFPPGADPSGFSWRVMRKRDDGLYNPTLPRSPGGTAPFTDGQIVKVDGVGITTLEVSELAFWAVDTKIDDLTLYNTYGYFFTNPRLSTETYRSLVRGLMQLYILGPALARLESALNLTASLPTIRSEGEILVSYDNGVLASGVTGVLLINDVFEIPLPLFSTEAVGGFIVISDSDFYNNVGTFNIIEYISPTKVVLKPALPFTPDTNLKWLFTLNNKQTVTTDQNVYEYPLNIPMRTDVKDPANIDVLTFQAFESLTLAIQVTDYVQDPEWWHTITIPQELMPDTPGARRVVTPQLYPNILGPVGDANIGDPGFYIGRDEDSGNLAQGTTGKLLTGDLFEVSEANTFDATSVGEYVQIYTAANPTNVGIFEILTYLSPTQVVLVAGAYVPETLLTWGYFKGHLATKPYRHNAAFILMDRFLKLHMFAVLVDSSVSLTNILVTDLVKILKDVKPVHTALYFRPSTTFHDVIDLTEEALKIKMVRRQNEEITTLENDFIITPDVASGITGELLVGNIFQTPGATFSALSVGQHVHIDVAVNTNNVGTFVIATYISPTQVTLTPITFFTPEAGLTWGYYEGWLIGNTWKFANPVGGALTLNPGVGGIFVAIGGSDPSIQPADPTNIPPGGLPDLSWLDRSLYVYMHP